MKVSYNVTGEKRKSLVGAISQELNAPTKYLGAPTFAYEVGDPSRAGSYHIDKNGTLEGADNRDLVADLQGLHGFVPVADEFDEADDSVAWHDTCDREDRDEYGNWDGDPTPYYRKKDTTDENEAWAEQQVRRMRLESQNVPDYSNRGQYGGDDISNYEDLHLTEGEELGLGRERRENFQGENGMQASDVPEPDEPDRLTVEYPFAGFTPETLDNLTKMVTARESLLKAALGAEELPVQINEDIICFPWFILDDPGQAAYYIQFIWALCTTAKEKKRVTAKERGLADNPKYAMRCWLLSLGLIGDEYKNVRKLLLARLDGNSSFKGGSRPAYTTHCYTFPNSSREDAIDCKMEEFTSLAKAKDYCNAFANECESIQFAGAHVEDETGKYLYEILMDGTVNKK